MSVGLWPDFHSPLMWGFSGDQYILYCAVVYLFLPLIPGPGDGARTAPLAGLKSSPSAIPWASVVPKASEEFTYGDEHLCLGNHPVMLSVSAIVSWDFAMQSAWLVSTILGRTFVGWRLAFSIAV